MKYFIDHPIGHPDDKRRSWETVSPDFVSAQITGQRVIHEGQEVNSGLILAHRSAVIGPAGLDPLTQLVASNKGLRVIVVHGGFQTERDTLHPRLYCRRWPVDNPIDRTFTECWRRFVLEFDSDRIAYGLLEPTSTPYLSALKILLAAQSVLVGAHNTQKEATAVGFEAWLKEVFGCKDTAQLSAQLQNDLPVATVKAIVDSINSGDLTELSDAIEEYSIE